MKYRKIRIAWSVAWGLLAVLLCVLWVRSYWQEQLIKTSEANLRVFASRYGGLSMNAISVPIPPSQSGWEPGWVYKSQPLPKNYYSPAWQVDFGQVTTIVSFPHWLIVLVFAVTAAVLWLPYRFSLRTLLIGMTLVAALLGTVVWAVR